VTFSLSTNWLMLPLTRRSSSSSASPTLRLR
jgi:hypothetical protein